MAEIFRLPSAVDDAINESADFNPAALGLPGIEQQE